MLGRYLSYFSHLLVITLAFGLRAQSAVARAGNPLADLLIVQRAAVSTPLIFDTDWATTLYYAAQTGRLPLPEPLSIQAVSPVFFWSATSLVVSTNGSIFDPLGRALGRATAGKSGAHVSFASGINDTDVAEETGGSAENSALFYSANNAPNASSENGFRESGGQIRTKPGAAGSAAAPSAADLFSVPTQ